MNAKVKPAAFMPLFATTTVEGPVSHAALIEQMHAAGMMAGAWMVEGMAQRLEQLEQVAGELEPGELRRTQESAYDLMSSLRGISRKLERIAVRLSNADSSGEVDELAGTVDELAEDLTRLANQAEEIGDTTPYERSTK